jgi:hypothetical protein
MSPFRSRKGFSVGTSAMLGFLLAAICAAQAVQTGTLTGNVRLADGTAIPGVSVTASSPSLQGTRTQASGANGDFIFKFLPPGEYVVRFELAGMQTVTKTASVELGGTTRVDAGLEVAAAAEAVTVTGDALELEKTAVHQSNYGAEMVQQLPVGRRLDQIAVLAPGVTANTPNVGQVQISGGFAYDNLILLNGVDVIDNQFGDATTGVVIEEAIAETQVMSSGISAEFGRFSGGVVNAITKSGGNELSGSFRADFTNTDWADENPFEVENDVVHEDDLFTTYSATLGGSLIHDRLWFFLAGRYYDESPQEVVPITGQSYNSDDTEYRIEGKLTFNVASGHSVTAAYTDSNREVLRTSFGFTADLADLWVEKDPTDLFVASYNGVLTSNLFATVQYSQKQFGFRADAGSTRIEDSPFLTFNQANAHYNGRYFDYGTDPEDRDNRQISASLSHFLSTASAGTHDIKGGAELYQSIAKGGNSQSATDVVFFADYAVDADENPILDADGNLIPSFVPFNVLWVNWRPDRGAESTIDTWSFYVNDIWRIGKFTANVGLRYEQVKGEAEGGITIADESAFVPRLGLSYDVQGDGRYVLSGTYGQYSGRYSDGVFNRISNVGNPDLVYYVYLGPEGQGTNFAPGFDLSNYALVYGQFPEQTVFFQDGLSSPITSEWTLSAGSRLLPNLYGAVTYVNRKTEDFVESFIAFENGRTLVDFEGDLLLFDNVVYENTSDRFREYEAINFQGGWDITPRFRTQLAYTYTLKYEGNYEGEGPNQPGLPSNFGDYPEFTDPDRTEPSGRMAGYQKHKLRLMAGYDLPTPIGRFGFGAIWRYDSGTPYSLTTTLGGGLTPEQAALDPGYATPPATQPIYFGERGSGLFEDITRLDLALEWALPVGPVEPWVKVSVVNVFNEDSLVSHNTTVFANNGPNDPKDALGLPTTFRRSVNFGRANSVASYQLARTFSFAAGLRF